MSNCPDSLYFCSSLAASKDAPLAIASYECRVLFRSSFWNTSLITYSKRGVRLASPSSSIRLISFSLIMRKSSTVFLRNCSSFSFNSDSSVTDFSNSYCVIWYSRLISSVNSSIENWACVSALRAILDFSISLSNLKHCFFWIVGSKSCSFLMSLTTDSSKSLSKSRPPRLSMLSLCNSVACFYSPFCYTSA